MTLKSSVEKGLSPNVLCMVSATHFVFPARFCAALPVGAHIVIPASGYFSLRYFIRLFINVVFPVPGPPVINLIPSLANALKDSLCDAEN